MLNPKSSPVKRACLHCHNDHKKCDTNRPCLRCVARGVDCVEQGGKRKRKDYEESLEERAAKKGVMMVSFRFASGDEKLPKAQKGSDQPLSREFSQSSTTQQQPQENQHNEIQVSDSVIDVRNLYNNTITNTSGSEGLRNEVEYHTHPESTYNYPNHSTTSDIHSHYSELNQNREMYPFPQSGNVGQLYQAYNQNYPNFFPNGAVPVQYELLYSNPGAFEGRLAEGPRISPMPSVSDVPNDMHLNTAISRRNISSMDSTGGVNVNGMYTNREFSVPNNYSNQNLLNTMDHYKLQQQQYSTMGNGYFQNNLSDSDPSLRKSISNTLPNNIADGIDYNLHPNANVTSNLNPSIQSFMQSNLSTNFNTNPTFSSSLNPAFNTALGTNLNPNLNSNLNSTMQLSGQNSFANLGWGDKNDGQLHPGYSNPSLSPSMNPGQGILADPELIKSFNDPNVGIAIIGKKVLANIFQHPEGLSQLFLCNETLANMLQVPHERLIDQSFPHKNIGLYAFCKAVKDSPTLLANHRFLMDEKVQLLELKLPLQTMSGFINVMCRIHMNYDAYAWVSFEKVDKLDDGVIVDGKVGKARRVFNSPDDFFVYYNSSSAYDFEAISRKKNE